jgi:hypothetical protein
MGEGEGGGGQNRFGLDLIPPPLHPLPRWGGEFPFPELFVGVIFVKIIACLLVILQGAGLQIFSLRLLRLFIR